MPTTAVKKPEAPAACHWANRTARAIHALLHPASYLVPAPASATLDDRLAAIAAVDPELATPRGLLPLLLQPSELVPMATAGGGLDLQPVPHNRHRQAALARAGRCAGGLRHEERKDFFEERLDTIDRSIIARLDAGQQHAALVRTDDFGEVMPVAIEGRESVLWAGIVDARLPEANPFHSWDKALLYDLPGATRRQHGVLLGLGRPDRPDLVPRPFYPADQVARLTIEGRLHQIRRRLDGTRLSLTEITELHAAQVKCEELGPSLIRKAARSEAHVELPELSWTEGVRFALDVATGPHHFITAPPADATLDDLLLIRQRFGVDDTQPHPNRRAATDLANRCGGTARKELLAELIEALLASLDRPMTRYLSEGIIWACRQAAARGK